MLVFGFRTWQVHVATLVGVVQRPVEWFSRQRQVLVHAHGLPDNVEEINKDILGCLKVTKEYAQGQPIEKAVAAIVRNPPSACWPYQYLRFRTLLVNIMKTKPSSLL